MAEYIEREEAIKAVQHAFAFHSYAGGAAANAIAYIPAADVRPVVLCRDCMMRQYCKVAQYLGADGFCSNGEKMEES